MPNISKEKIEQAIYALEYGIRPQELDAITMLQGLLDQPEAWQSATKGDVSKARLYFDKEEVLLPLYTHPPAPRKQITADTVTDEMIHDWHANTFGAQAMGGVTDRDMIVAAVNAYLTSKVTAEPLNILDDDEWTELWIACSDENGSGTEIEMSLFSEKVQHAFCAKNNLTLEKP